MVTRGDRTGFDPHGCTIHGVKPAKILMDIVNDDHRTHPPPEIRLVIN